jgi:hypothetical protein
MGQEKQHLGGWKGAGTEDTLVLFDTWIRKQWDEKKFVAGLFLNVKSAYPSVHPKRLIQYLSSLQCPAYLVGIIDSFLANRKNTICMDNYTSRPFDIAIGLPQGSPPLRYPLHPLKQLLAEKGMQLLKRDSISIGYT